MAFLAASSIASALDIGISGMGWLENRRLKHELMFLQGVGQEEEAELDAVGIEDLVYLLFGQLRELGYWHPAITAQFEFDGVEHEVLWDRVFAPQLLLDGTTDTVQFIIERGVLYYYDRVEVRGIGVIPATELERFFIPGGTIFVAKSDRAFTDKNFTNRISRLQRTLDSMGYRQALATAFDYTIDEDTGAVDAWVEFRKGPMHKVARIEVVDTSGLLDAGELEIAMEGRWTGSSLSRGWMQDVRQEALNQLLHAGYPDARVSATVAPLANGEGAGQDELPHIVRLEAIPGPLITLSGVRFENLPFVRNSTMRRQSRLRPGQPLDLLEAGEARRRLMGLGTFQTIDFELQASGSNEREVVFSGQQGLTSSLELLAGWGSYEMARIGARYRHRNLWRRAHGLELETIASLRSRNARLTYTVPQIFGTLANAYARLQHFHREEPSHDWQEDQFAFGTSTALGRSGIIAHFEYQIESLSVDRAPDRAFLALEDAIIASLGARLSLDRRDNPLYPTAGYSWSVSLKTATRAIGGEVDFQKLEMRASYHKAIRESQILHVGVRFGSLYSWKDKLANLPFGERFFIGGESSLRSYREGGASPRDDNGERKGAQAFVLLNLEWEQRISRGLSLVTFVDALWQAADSSLSMDSDPSLALGLGLRYRTPVGPLRLEYGHNPDPRPEDPRGAWHLSVGFPF